MIIVIVKKAIINNKAKSRNSLKRKRNKTLCSKARILPNNRTSKV